MDRMNCVNGFDFDNDQLFYKQIDSETEFNFLSFKDYGEGYLACYIEPTFAQFVMQAALINALEKSRAEPRMEVHSRRNNRSSDPIDTKGLKRCWCGHVSLHTRGFDASL